MGCLPLKQGYGCFYSLFLPKGARAQLSRTNVNLAPEVFSKPKKITLENQLSMAAKSWTLVGWWSHLLVTYFDPWVKHNINTSVWNSPNTWARTQNRGTTDSKHVCGPFLTFKQCLCFGYYISEAALVCFSVSKPDLLPTESGCRSDSALLIHPSTVKQQSWRQ